jgi:hypothetical protein
MPGWRLRASRPLGGVFDERDGGAWVGDLYH